MEWDEIERVMVVFAHPDDAEFGSAGTSARLAKEGKQVFYVVATDGSKGSSDAEMTVEKLIALRKDEQCAAAEIIGVADVAFLGFEDAMLEPTLELRKAITAAIRRFKPDVVICPTPERNLSMGVFVQHPDHLATGEAALAAIYPASRDRMTFPDLLTEGLEPHTVREVWLTGTGMPDLFVDITDTMETKLRALEAHESQIDPKRVAEFIPERARQTAEQQGQGAEFAEGFRRIQIG